MSYGRRYVLSGENLTLGTGSVLAAIQTAASGAGSVIEILRIEVSQSATATAAQVRLAAGTRNTSGTLTVTSATPQNLTAGGPASGIAGNTAPAGGAGRCGVNSSADSGGTYTDIWPVATNNLNGWCWVPVPEERLLVPPSTLFTVRFLTAPGTTTGWTVAVVYQELV